MAYIHLCTVWSIWKKKQLKNSLYWNVHAKWFLSPIQRLHRNMIYILLFCLFVTSSAKKTKLQEFIRAFSMSWAINTAPGLQHARVPRFWPIGYVKLDNSFFHKCLNYVIYYLGILPMSFWTFLPIIKQINHL